MKNQFFDFENNYSEKTSWVKHLEMEIEEAERKQKELNSKLTEAKDQELELLEQFGQQSNEDDSQNLVELSQKSFKHELLMMKIKNWTDFNAEKYSLEGLEGAEPLEVVQALCNKIKETESSQNNVSQQEEKPQQVCQEQPEAEANSSKDTSRRETEKSDI